MGHYTAGLVWVSGLVVWIFLGAAALWPDLARWEDLVFLGAPVLLLPQALYACNVNTVWERATRFAARVALLAFIALMASLFIRDAVTDVWFLGLACLVLLAGPATAASASMRVNSSGSISIVGWIGVASGMLWTVLMAVDVFSNMTWPGWIGLAWIVTHSAYAIGAAISGH